VDRPIEAAAEPEAAAPEAHVHSGAGVELVTVNGSVIRDTIRRAGKLAAHPKDVRGGDGSRGVPAAELPRLARPPGGATRRQREQWMIEFDGGTNGEDVLGYRAVTRRRDRACFELRDELRACILHRHYQHQCEGSNGSLRLGHSD
jgi:hypothetical protein